MKKIKKAIISLCVAILLASAIGTGQNAFAKTTGHRLIGIVLDVDNNTRTLKVQDRESKRIYTVAVPINTPVKLYVSSATAHSQSFVEFERVMRGLVIDVQLAE